MSDKYIRGYNGSVVLTELPGEYDVPWFKENYRAYLQAALDDETSNKNLGRFLYSRCRVCSCRFDGGGWALNDSDRT